MYISSNYFMEDDVEPNENTKDIRKKAKKWNRYVIIKELTERE